MPWTKGSLLWVRDGREPNGTIFVLRKRLGTAVRRNRLKRRLRHATRELSVPDAGLVILAQPPAVRSSFHALKVELGHLLARLNASDHAP